MPGTVPDNAIFIIAGYLPIVSLLRVSLVNKQARNKVKEILELSTLANLKRQIILGQLSARCVWPAKDWMDLVKLMNNYDRVYKDGFYSTGYDIRISS
jgi:hypothetical protein